MASNENIITVGEKRILASGLYSPQESVLPHFSGRETEMRMITAAWMADQSSLPMNPLLTGDPGVGKNRLVYELARQTGHPLFILQGHEDLTAEDLVCSVRLGDHQSVEYVGSPLLSAMARGGILFIDEIGLIRPRALSLLVSLLDERRYIDSTLLGTRIFAQQGFRFIAATNSSTAHLLPEYILSRLRPRIHVGHPSKEEVSQILLHLHKPSGSADHHLIDRFWILWSGFKKGEEVVSPRDAILVFGLAWKISAMEQSGEIQPCHLEQAFHQIFNC